VREHKGCFGLVGSGDRKRKLAIQGIQNGTRSGSARSSGGLRFFPAGQIVSRVNAFRDAIATWGFELFTSRARADDHDGRLDSRRSRTISYHAP
jgi:hypothetical protein